MVLYECFRCGYNTKLKGNLKHHLNRKNICDAIEDDVDIEEIKNYYGFDTEQKLLQNAPNCSKIAPNCSKIAPTDLIDIAPNCSKLLQNCSNIAPNCSILLQNSGSKATCEYCLRTYSRNSNLTKHLKICKKKKEAEMLAITQNEKIIKMEKQIKELENLKIHTQNNTTNNITTTNNNNINNSKNIYINNYGNENLKHLRNKDFAKLLDGIYNAVPKLIEKIHFDPKHPENQNIKYTNKRSQYLKVIKDNKWQLVNKKHELLDLIDDKCFMLKEKYYNILEKKKYNITEAHRDKIEEFMEKYNEEDKKMMIDLIERTELMLLNNS